MNAKTEGIIITEEDHGRRADNFLFNILKHVPKTRVYRAIRKGEVRVNKKRIKPDYKLQAGDQVRIPPISQPEQAPEVRPSDSLIELLQQSILYEDSACLVLNKPSGIAVHGGSGIQLGIIEALRIIYPKLNMELAHRLDRDTSGCLIVGKKSSATRNFHAQLREGKMRKIYQCLIKGKLSAQKVVVDKALYKDQLAAGGRVVRIDAERGKPSLSIFRVAKTYRDASLINVELKTGRTHQIRVHAASLSTPVVGDTKYGDKVFNQEMRLLGLKRLFLHAAELSFVPPGQETKITIKSPLEEHLAYFLNQLPPQ